MFRIELQACDPSRNLWRFYMIEAGRDLFDDLVVRLHYGRIGTRGQTKTHIVPDSRSSAARALLSQAAAISPETNRDSLRSPGEIRSR